MVSVIVVRPLDPHLGMNGFGQTFLTSTDEEVYVSVCVQMYLVFRNPFVLWWFQLIVLGSLVGVFSPLGI